MNKIIGSSVDNTLVSLAALKSSDKGDMLVFIDDIGSAQVWTVVDRDRQLGRDGFVSLTLQNVVDDSLLDIIVKKSLPGGVLWIRSVSKGVNARTLRKAEAIGNAVVIPPTDPNSRVSAVLAGEIPAQVVEPVAVTPIDALLSMTVAQESTLPLDLPEVVMEPASQDSGMDVASCGPEDDIASMIAEVIALDATTV